MKKSFVNCICFVLVVIVVITSALALKIKKSAESYDLIKETKKLYPENRRDDALVLAKTFKGINKWGNDELAKLEKQLEYSVTEIFKSALWNGATKGEVYDHYSGLPLPIIGATDLIEEDDSGTIIITDWKTSARAYGIDEVDRNQKLTCYQRVVTFKCSGKLRRRVNGNEI